MADEVTLPSEKELEELPPWAVVAFAARCARRIYPILLCNFPLPSRQHKDAVANTLTHVERMAAFADPRNAHLALRANEVLSESRRGGAATFAAARAAYAAAAVASGFANSYAEFATDPVNCERAAQLMLPESVRISSIAAGDTGRAVASVDPCAIPMVRADFSTLLRLSRDQGWQRSSPVPPWVFGPMWPDGVPDGWPEGDPDERLVMRLTAPVGATPVQIEEMKAKLLGGVETVGLAAGMTPEQFRHFVTVEVLQPAGVGNG